MPPSSTWAGSRPSTAACEVGVSQHQAAAAAVVLADPGKAGVPVELSPSRPHNQNQEFEAMAGTRGESRMTQKPSASPPCSLHGSCMCEGASAGTGSGGEMWRVPNLLRPVSFSLASSAGWRPMCRFMRHTPSAPLPQVSATDCRAGTQMLQIAARDDTDEKNKNAAAATTPTDCRADSAPCCSGICV